MAYDPIIDFYDEPGGPNGGYKGSSSGGGGSLGTGHNVFVTGASSFTVDASDDPLDLPPVGKMAFASSDGESLVMLPAGVNVCFNLSSSGFTVTNESTGEEVESVTREYEQYGITYYYLYFVMPDSDVSVSDASSS